jgi:hypothetical protein
VLVIAAIPLALVLLRPQRAESVTESSGELAYLDEAA